MISILQEQALKDHILDKYCFDDGVECVEGEVPFNIESIKTDYVKEDHAMISINDGETELIALVEYDIVFIYVNDVLMEEKFNINILNTDSTPRESAINIGVIDVDI